MLLGLQKIDGKTYYFNSGGDAATRTWKAVEGKCYYFNSSGAAVTGWCYIGADQYHFDEDGVLVPSSAKYLLIEGESSVTVNQMVKYFQNSKKTYPAKELGKGGASTIEEFCRIFYEEANAENIKVEVAFAQTMKETGWLQFGGDVKIEQYNFAGLGATGNGVRGESFPDVRTGVRAQIQHLKAYGSTKPLINTCVDKRFTYVERGCAIYVEWLGIPDNPNKKGWAAAKGYGYDIVEMIYAMKTL